jgi:O-antigen/teichoic acid export membrane protein
VGVIRQQTIKGTFYSYLGVVIGFVNIAVLSPLVFTSDQIGLTQVLIAVTTILAQVGSLGFNNVTNRLFPYFRSDSKEHNGFLSLAFLVTTAGFIISLVLLFIYHPRFADVNQEKSSLLSAYAFYIPLLLGMVMLFNLLDNYCKVLFNATIGIALKEVVIRLLNLAFIILFYFGIIDFGRYMLLFVLSQAVPAILIIIYLFTRGEFRFTGFMHIIDRSLFKQMASLCLYGIIAGLSGIALTNIDKYMVNHFNGLTDAGIYSIAVYFATLILIPARSLGKISVPVVAEAWKRNDLEQIRDIYKKSSINQFIIGMLILVGIFGNMNNIFRLLPQEYSAGEMVIIFYSLANIINISTGVSQYILGTSSLYRYQTYLMIILILVLIFSNLILIPYLGMTGAAIASLISMFVFTLLTLILLKVKFNLWPFCRNHFIMLALSGIIWAVSCLIPEMGLTTDIVLRSAAITIMFIAATLIFRLSDDAMNIWKQVIHAIRKY